MFINTTNLSLYKVNNISSQMDSEAQKRKRLFINELINTLVKNRQKAIEMTKESEDTISFVTGMMGSSEQIINLAKDIQAKDALNNKILRLMRRISDESQDDDYQSIVEDCHDDLEQILLKQQKQLKCKAFLEAQRQAQSIQIHSKAQSRQEQTKPNIKPTQCKSKVQSSEIGRSFSFSSMNVGNPNSVNKNSDNFIIQNGDNKGKSIEKKEDKRAESSKDYSNQKPSIGFQDIISPQNMINLRANLSNMLQIHKPFQAISSGGGESMQLPKKYITDQLVIQVRYLSNLVDMKYDYNNHSLQEFLVLYINNFLGIEQNRHFNVKKQTPQIKLIDQTATLATSQDDFYRFNPFHDALEIYLKTKNKLSFTKPFIIEGNLSQLEITWISYEPQDWKKSVLTLKAKSSIEEVAQHVCDKMQTENMHFIALVHSLKSQGVYQASHLFKWDKDDYKTAKIRTNQIHQLQAVIQQIKGQKNVVQVKSQKKEHLQCLKTATTHKILRYLVFEVTGKKGLQKIAWLNLQNVSRAINIVKQEIFNQELLDKLEKYFGQYALDFQEEHNAFSRGMILYGPPGTGKTVVTQTLPNLMGFHLIEKGLSAADFSQSLVGQTSKMIKSLTSRANLSPYLLCSLAIDEVDGLVPDRKDKDQKNKGEGISILLSVIGGNKDVPNLTYMTSTNYIKKIDQAIGRRLNGRYQVGRPKPSERACIIKKKVKYFNDKDHLLNHLVRITTNFTGAALGGLAASLNSILILKKMKKVEIELTIDEITKSSIQSAKKFTITFGQATLPQIYFKQSNQNFIFSKSFLQRIMNQLVILQHQKDDSFTVLYANQIQRFSNGYLIPENQPKVQRLNIAIKNNGSFTQLTEYVHGIFESNYPKKYEYKIFQFCQYGGFDEYSGAIKAYLREILKKKSKQKTILMIEDFMNNPFQIIKSTRLFERNFPQIFIIYYLSPKIQLQTVRKLFVQQGPDKKQLQGKYTGRIMVELQTKTRMAFELSGCHKQQSRVAFRLFLKSKQINQLNQAIPQLVEYFTQQQVSYLLLIDYKLMSSNNAYDEKKMLQVLDQKMDQALSYKTSAVIIDLDALITLSKNISNSNFGQTESFSIQNQNIFRHLLDYMKSFPSTTGENNRWLTIVVKHPQLKKYIKSELSWPLYPEEVDENQRQQQMDEKKKCHRCNMEYTDRDNQKQRKCMQHPGRVIDKYSETFDDRDLINIRAEACSMSKDKQAYGQRYVWACCLKGLNQQGECPYMHISKQQYNTSEDQHMVERQKRKKDWIKSLELLESSKRNLKTKQKKSKNH